MQTPSNTNIPLNYTPSDSTINSLQTQISTLQQQNQNQQLHNQLELQNNQMTLTQIQQQLTKSQSDFQEYKRKTDDDLNNTKKSLHNEVWNGLPGMKISEMCTKVNTNFKYNNSVQAVQQINKLQVGEICNSLSIGAPIVNIEKISESGANIYTVPIQSNNITPMCNSKATSSASYQTSPCVCNQFSSTPILHTGEIVNKGIISALDKTITGYYCSAD
jgi:hypothetical protein